MAGKGEIVEKNSIKKILRRNIFSGDEIASEEKKAI